MADYGIKISKSGYDYDDGDRRLIYNSKYPLLKIKSIGTGTLTVTSGSGSKTVLTHSLGYKPFFYLWINYLDITSGTEIEKLRMCSWSEYAGLGVSSYYDAWTTTTTLELDVTTAFDTNATLDYVYVVFYDPLS
jgi:capsule polysaccharide modification protein KpsS